MVKRILIIAAVAAVFAAGCRRKTPSGQETDGNGQAQKTPQQQQQQKGKQTQQQQPEAPPGMALIEGVGDEPIFIRREPVTVQEYIDFLEATGRSVPERYSGSGVDTDRPVTGLTLRRARQLAKWMLGQLPSAREWQAAPNSVVSGTYPWRLEQGEDNPRPGAKVYIVKHYRPGGEGEEQARQRKKKMLSNLVASRRDEVEKLRQEVSSELQEVESNWQDIWKQYKTAFFNYLELQAKQARRQAEKTRKQTVATFLNQVRERKIQNLISLQQSDASAQEMQQAVEKYRNFLSQQVQQVKDKRNSLEDQMSGMSDRVLQMKQKVESAGSSMLKPMLTSIRGELEDVPTEFDDIEAAMDARDTLQEIRKNLEDARGRVSTMESRLSELQSQIETLKQETEGEAADIEKLDRSIQEEKDKLSGLSDTLERSFENEQKLFDALQKLSSVSIKKKVQEAQIEELQSALDMLGSGDENGSAQNGG